VRILNQWTVNVWCFGQWRQANKSQFIDGETSFAFSRFCLNKGWFTLVHSEARTNTHVHESCLHWRTQAETACLQSADVVLWQISFLSVSRLLPCLLFVRFAHQLSFG